MTWLWHRVAVAALPDVIPAGQVELRRCAVGDLDALMRAIELSQPELARWLPWAEPMPTEAAELDFLHQRIVEFDADVDWSYFLIELGSGHLVGGAGLHPRAPRSAEIGYWVRSDRTRRGYATMAAGALTGAALASLASLPWVEQVLIRMDQANLASAAVPPKLGYCLAGQDPTRQVLAAGHTGKGWIWAVRRDAWKQ